LLRRSAATVIYTAAAGGPPPTWMIDELGANALLFRSTDHGSSFAPIPFGDGNPNPMRGMVMKLIAQPDDDRVVFGALSDGTVIRIDEREAVVSIIAEKLPPAYDLAVLP
jgi:hypothetical protein